MNFGHFKYCFYFCIQQVKEFLEKTRRIQHFESTEKTTDQAILGLMRGFCEKLISSLDTDSILAELRTELRSNNSKKLELWEELKVVAVARTTALVYATSLLVCSLRVHLNVIGGYLYKETQQSTEKITKEVQTMYSLVLIQHLMNSGLNQLMSLVRENVTKVMKNHSLKEKMALSDVEQIFWSIQHAVNKDINKNLLQFILPPEFNRTQQEENLNKMLLDAIDVYECGDFIEVCEATVSQGFAVVIDKIADFYSEPINGKNKLNEKNPTDESSTSNSIQNDCNNGYVNIHNVLLPLAKLIPILNALTSQVPSNDANQNNKNLASSLIVLQLQNQMVKNLGSNVYEVYSN